MHFLATDNNSVSPWLTLLLPFAGGVVGAALGPYISPINSRRQERRKAFDLAISGLRRAQMHRHYPNNVPTTVLGPDLPANEAFNSQLVQAGVLRFTDSMNAARSAIADLEPHYVPSGNYALN